MTSIMIITIYIHKLVWILITILIAAIVTSSVAIAIEPVNKANAKQCDSNNDNDD